MYPFYFAYVFSGVKYSCGFGICVMVPQTVSDADISDAFFTTELVNRLRKSVSNKNNFSFCYRVYGGVSKEITLAKPLADSVQATVTCPPLVIHH